MGLVTEKTEVAYLKSLLCIVVKRHFKSLHLILSHSGIFETIILQFAPHIDVGWSRGSNSRCRVPKEVSRHCNGRVKSILKADKGIGKRVSRVVLKMSGKFIQPGSGK